MGTALRYSHSCTLPAWTGFKPEREPPSMNICDPHLEQKLRTRIVTVPAVLAEWPL